MPPRRSFGSEFLSPVPPHHFQLNYSFYKHLGAILVCNSAKLLYLLELWLAWSSAIPL